MVMDHLPTCKITEVRTENYSLNFWSGSLIIKLISSFTSRDCNQHFLIWPLCWQSSIFLFYSSNLQWTLTVMCRCHTNNCISHAVHNCNYTNDINSSWRGRELDYIITTIECDVIIIFSGNTATVNHSSYKFITIVALSEHTAHGHLCVVAEVQFASSGWSYAHTRCEFWAQELGCSKGSPKWSS